jgi:dsDNA-binding SOS-regulon protein
MYERMLQMQDDNAAQLLRSRDASEDRQLEMMRVTLAQQTAASDKVEKALNRSVESAEKVTKDSIGAMSQV